MEIEDELDETPTAPRKFHAVFVLPHLFAFLTNVAMAWRMLFAGITDELAGHVAHVHERDTFEASAGAEIERLVKGEVDG